MHGFAVRLPRGREVFVEVRRQWLGFGSECHGDDRELYLGFIQMTYSRSVVGHRLRFGLIAGGAALFLAGLAVPAINAVEAFDWFAHIVAPLNTLHDDLEDEGITLPEPFESILDAADRAATEHDNQLPR